MMAAPLVVPLAPPSRLSPPAPTLMFDVLAAPLPVWMKALLAVPVPPPLMVIVPAVMSCAASADRLIPALLLLPDVPPLMLIAFAVMCCGPPVVMTMADADTGPPGAAVPPVILI